MWPIDVLTSEIIEPQWIVKDMIPREAAIILAGEAGAGKSYLMYSMAYAIVTGRQFLGHDTVPTKILYFDEENAEADFRQYNQWAWAALGCPSIQGFNDQLRLEHFALLSGWRGIMTQIVKEFQPGLVIIDTATSAFNLVDENDNAEAQRTITDLRRIQELVVPKPTLVVLKHEKQRDEITHRRTIRGAKVWLGSFDQVLYHSVADGRPRKDGLRRTKLHPDKLRAFALRHDIKINPRFSEDTPKGLILEGSWADEAEKETTP